MKTREVMKLMRLSDKVGVAKTEKKKKEPVTRHELLQDAGVSKPYINVGILSAVPYYGAPAVVFQGSEARIQEFRFGDHVSVACCKV